MEAFSPLAIEFAAIVVTAMVLSVIARWTGQPTLVAYIMTGILLGPVVLGWVTETAFITLLSELGLGFLLFLIGMEMDFEDIRELFRPILRISILQTILQTSLAFLVSYALGFSLIETSILALATVFGSTPEVVKLLSDKDEISTLPSRIDIGVLLVQDIILIITLALLSAPSFDSIGVIATNFAKVLFMVAMMGGSSYLASRYLLSSHFRSIADDDHAFFVHGLAWAFIFISVGQYFGLSLEIGAFLAGLSLGQIPYSDELRERIRPLTDLFMVVFFASIGLRLTTESLLFYWKEALLASGALMIGNFIIMFYLIDRERFTPETSFKGSINMTQVSEFSLVVGSIAVAQGFIGQAILGYLSLMAVLTMSVSAYFINYSDQIYQRVRHLLTWLEAEDKTDIEIGRLEDHALIIGYNDLVRSVLPVIEEFFETIVVVDRDPGNVEELSRSSYEFIFGDFKHGQLRAETAIDRAGMIFSVSMDHIVNLRLLEDRDPSTLTFLRTGSREHAAELYDMGADYIIRHDQLAAEQLRKYIDDYIAHRERFLEETSDDLAMIRWGARDDE